MDYLGEGLTEALRMILAFDREFAAIVAVSLKVATLSTCLATLLGVTVGIAVAENRFRGRQHFAPDRPLKEVSPGFFVEFQTTRRPGADK